MGSTPQQLRAAQELWQEKARQQREARFEDFMDLVSMGSGVEEAAARVGTTLRAINRQAYRHGRPDIGRLTNMARYI
jgi:hypothetical protein